MAFLQTRRRDLYELRLLQLLDGGRARVTHGRTQPTGQLMDDRREWTTERHPPLDSFWNQLVFGKHVVLEVAVLGVRLGAGAALHRAERPHAPIALELLTVDEDQLAGRLRGARQQRTQHRRRSTGGQRLG